LNIYYLFSSCQVSLSFRSGGGIQSKGNIRKQRGGQQAIGSDIAKIYQRTEEKGDA
jgi:hypothetical protein